MSRFELEEEIKRFTGLIDQVEGRYGFDVTITYDNDDKLIDHQVKLNWLRTDDGQLYHLDDQRPSGHDKLLSGEGYQITYSIYNKPARDWIYRQFM